MSPTVLVGFAVWLFATAQEANKEYTADLNRMIMLHQEIGERLVELKAEIDHDQKESDFIKNVNPNGVDFAEGIYPDLRNRSTTGMIVELQSLVRKHKTQPQDIIDALTAVETQIRAIRKRTLDLKQAIGNEAKTSDGKLVADAIHLGADELNRTFSAQLSFDEYQLVDDNNGLSWLRRLIAPTYTNSSPGK